MTIELALAIFGALGVLVGGAWALLKIAMGQFDRRLDEKFKTLEQARAEGRNAYEERFRRGDMKYEELDREVRKILIDMPDKFVRREDYVRRESLIEAKIDKLGVSIQNWMLEGRNNA